MNGLKPIKMPSAKEKVAAELRKAILSRQMQEGAVNSFTGAFLLPVHFWCL